MSNPIPEFSSFEEFWPFYVAEHSDATNRKLHFIGTSLAMAMAANPLLWPALPIAGYGFAWVGHFGFEKNKPASFKHPFWSFRGDLRMWKKIATGKMQVELERALALYPRPDAT
jgi:hypothetical protein